MNWQWHHNQKFHHQFPVKMSATAVGTTICLVSFLLFFSISSCNDSDTSDPFFSRCENNNLMHCVSDDSCELAQVCDFETPICDNELGCIECLPNTEVCIGDGFYNCGTNGHKDTLIKPCQNETTCIEGACRSACDYAAEKKSYLGCHFFATSTVNGDLDTQFDNDFAIIVGNPEGFKTASITIMKGDEVVATDSVPPKDVTSIKLPMIKEVLRASRSAKFEQASYEVISNTPVAVYQFNPVHFSIRAMETIYSHSNDASLLLPTHTLSNSYRVNSMPTWGCGNSFSTDWTWRPGFAAIIATEDDTQVTFTPKTTDSIDSSVTLLDNRIEIQLNKGDVYQLLSRIPNGSGSICQDNQWPLEGPWTKPDFDRVSCTMFCSAQGYDLTGSLIESNKSLAVFTGHSCSFAPFNAWACDHLEEVLLPTETWGNVIPASSLVHPSGASHGVVPSIFRVLAHSDETIVEFTPPVHEQVTLNGGEFVEFETKEDFIVSSTNQIHLSQLMLSQSYVDSEAGDPALGIGTPIFQARKSYSFLTPSTFVSSYVNVIAQTLTEVEVDKVPITQWSSIKGTKYKVARILVTPGEHEARSTAGTGFVIVAYGYAPFTSYLYPGGLNLKNYLE